jgi:hypothetical protein
VKSIRNLKARLRLLERQVRPDPPGTPAVLPPEFVKLERRISAAWCERILEGRPPALDHAHTSLVDAVVIMASFFDHETPPANITEAFEWHVARVYPAAGDERRDVPRGFAEKMRALLRVAYLAARAEGMTDAQIAADEIEHHR